MRVGGGERHAGADAPVCNIIYGTILTQRLIQVCHNVFAAFSVPPPPLPPARTFFFCTRPSKVAIEACLCFRAALPRLLSRFAEYTCMTAAPAVTTCHLHTQHSLPCQCQAAEIRQRGKTVVSDQTATKLIRLAGQRTSAAFCRVSSTPWWPVRICNCCPTSR